jgi:hypothetical protein
VGIAKMVRSAKYLPNTIFPTETGAVRISWSVLLCRSSASIRIVSTGTEIKNTKITEEIA